MIEKISFLITSYNHQKFIREAFLSAVNQTYSNIEFVFVDDYSKDNTFKIIEELYEEFKEIRNIKIYRNLQNRGLVYNLHYSIKELCSGSIIVVGAGDDISMVDRVEKTLDYFTKNKVSLVFSNAIYIDEHNNEYGTVFHKTPIFSSNLDDVLCDERNLISKFRRPTIWCLGASCAFYRNLITDFPPMNEKVLQEDGVLAMRALLENGIGYIDKPLLKYRRHINAVSNQFSVKNRLKILRYSYIYLENQLSDVKFKGENILINKLKKELYFRKFISIIYRIPFLSHLLVKFEVWIKSYFRNGKK